MRKVVVGLVAGALTAGVTAGSAGAAPNPSKDRCKDGGWQTLHRSSDGSGFKNQGQCVSYLNGGGTFAEDGGGGGGGVS